MTKTEVASEPATEAEVTESSQVDRLSDTQLTQNVFSEAELLLERGLAGRQFSGEATWDALNLCERKAYQRLDSKRQNLVDAIQIAASPQGREFLDQLLRSNSISQDEKTGVIDHLASIVDSNLQIRDSSKSTEVFKAELLENVLRSIVSPRSITQGKRSTCTVTAMQQELALNSPEEYARIMSELVTNGQVELRGGATLKLYNSELLEPGAVNDRYLDGQILQPALMQLAAENRSNRLDRRYTYNDVTDLTSDGRGHFKGLFGLDYDYVAGQLQDKGFRRLSIYNSDSNFENRDSVRDEIIAGITEQSGAMVEITTNVQGHAHHMIYVEKIVGDTVHIFNPWGQKEEWNKDFFKQHLVAALLENGETARNRTFVVDTASGIFVDGERVINWVDPPANYKDTTLKDEILKGEALNSEVQESELQDRPADRRTSNRRKEIVPGNSPNDSRKGRLSGGRWRDDEFYIPEE